MEAKRDDLRWRLEEIAVEGERQRVNSVPSGPLGESGGWVIVQRWDARYRNRLALAGLVVCWAAAALFVLVPFVNFFLTPLLAVLGPIVYWRIQTKESIILGGVMDCPSCHQAFEVGHRRMDYPFQAACPNCRAEFEVEATRTGEKRIAA